MPMLRPWPTCLRPTASGPEELPGFSRECPKAGLSIWVAHTKSSAQGTAARSFPYVGLRQQKSFVRRRKLSSPPRYGTPSHSHEAIRSVSCPHKSAHSPHSNLGQPLCLQSHTLIRRTLCVGAFSRAHCFEFLKTNMADASGRLLYSVGHFDRRGAFPRLIQKMMIRS